MKQWIVFFCCICIGAFPGLPQAQSRKITSTVPAGHLLFENILPEEGLPDPYTPGAYQDQQGFIWFSNKKGLIRYDGLHFKIYQHHPKDSASISNSFAWHITQDHRGIIWAPTHGGGLNRFDPVTETFSVFPLLPHGENKAFSGVVWSVMEDSRRRLWVGTRGAGLFIISRDRDSVARFVHDPENPESLSGNHIGRCFEDSRGRFWVPSESNGLNLFDPETGKSLRFRHEPGQPNSLASNHGIYGLAEDQNGNLWIASWNGLSVLDMTDTSFVTYFHEPGNPNSLSDNLVYSATVDSKNRVWLPTGRGLNRYDPVTKRFSHFFYDPLNPHSLIHDFVYSAYEARDGIVWITTANGISKWRPDNFSFISLVNTLEEKKKSNFEGGYKDILEDSRGNIWISTTSNGLFLYQPPTGTYRHFLPQPGWRGGPIQEDRNGRIWVSGTEGMILNSAYFEGNPQPIGGGTVYSIHGATPSDRGYHIQLHLDELSIRSYAAVIDLRPLEKRKRMNIHGIVGILMFRNYEILIDYFSRQILLFEVDNNGARIAPEPLPLPTETLAFRFKQHIPYIEARIDGLELKLGLDTGMEVNIFSMHILERLKNKMAPLPDKVVIGIGGKTTRNPAGLVEGLQVGSLILAGMETVFMSIGPVNQLSGPGLDGLLGQAFLKQFRVAFHLKRKEVYLWDEEAFRRGAPISRND